MAKNSRHDENHLRLANPPFDLPRVQRRGLLALGSLMALDLAGCGGGGGGSEGSPPPSAGSTQNGGVVTTLAGSGQTGSTDGAGAAAKFYLPYAVAADAGGTVYVADSQNNLIRKVTPAGVVSTLAGSGSAGSTNGTGNAASFSNPCGVAVAPDGTVYVADTANHMIRKITPAGIVTTLAGSGNRGNANGVGSAASFTFPYAVAVDASNTVYVGDTNNFLIRKITSDGVVTTLAGSGIVGSANGTGTAASFEVVRGIAVDASGTVYVADSGNSLIRKITPAGVVTTLAGSGQEGYADGTGAVALFSNPVGICVHSSGTVYVADPAINVIRKITPDGAVTTLAGKFDPSNPGGGKANGTGTTALFWGPNGIAVDGSNTVYVADTYNDLIRKIV
ncbi:NHL repeat-containing protein [Roseateles sp. BYS78W]|uniref:NHL repeat-containing protein n=1 Tax=Pelomonas candidula TaxID=3299025 RepID=A0ABW7HAH2_9BURK